MTESDPSSSPTEPPSSSKGFWQRLLSGRARNGDATVRDTLDELIEERDEAALPVSADERTLLANILDLRDRTIEDVMVPRAEIVGIDAATPMDEVIAVVTREGHSRVPVYRETLDNATGMVHIKDLLAWHGRAAEFRLAKVVRQVLFVSPSMHVLELLLEMRVSRCHMALVVDEYGGVDGLVTIEDLVEEIVGEIEDEFDRADQPITKRCSDGSLDAEARLEIEDLEQRVGEFVTEDEREDSDTVGGLVFALAGRVPIRGELIQHPSGFEFEILEADPRRIRRLKIRPPTDHAAPASTSRRSEPGEGDA